MRGPVELLADPLDQQRDILLVRGAGDPHDHHLRDRRMQSHLHPRGLVAGAVGRNRGRWWREAQRCRPAGPRPGGSRVRGDRIGICSDCDRSHLRTPASTPSLLVAAGVRGGIDGVGEYPLTGVTSRTDGPNDRPTRGTDRRVTRG